MNLKTSLMPLTLSLLAFSATANSFRDVKVNELSCAEVKHIVRTEGGLNAYGKGFFGNNYGGWTIVKRATCGFDEVCGAAVKTTDKNFCQAGQSCCPERPNRGVQL